MKRMDNLDELPNNGKSTDEIMESILNSAGYEPKGIKFFDMASFRQMILVAEGEPFAGWLCYLHPDGQWVSLRKATDEDVAKIQASKSETCRRCAGKGVFYYDGDTACPCPDCEGTGKCRQQIGG